MNNYKFTAEKAVNACVEWIKEWFNQNGKGCPAVLGISGGKDSSVAAALCVKALGKENVIGVLMPRGEQFDISFSYEICRFLGIKHYTVNIGECADALTKEIEKSVSFTEAAKINLPPRLRMSTVYAVSQCFGGRVVNTCNASEDYVGYSTRYGDSVGDFSPMSCFTVSEVKQMGHYLGIPEKFIEKPPIDGLSGSTDEEKLGFTYAELDAYIREGKHPSTPQIKEKIDRLHAANLFKLSYMPCFQYVEK